MRREETRVPSRRTPVFCQPRSSVAIGERGVAGAGHRHGDGVVHSDQHSGLRRKFEVLALARDDIGGTAGQAEAEATRDVAEDRTDERAATGPDGRADNIALDVVLFLNDLSFGHLQIFAALAFGLPARLLDGNDAHLHGDEAAIDFDGPEREVHVRLAAKDGKAAGLLHGADDAVHARTGGKQQLAAEVDGVGDNGDKRVAISGYGAADAAQESEMNLGALNDLARFGVRRGRGGANESCRQKKGQSDFHGFLLRARECELVSCREATPGRCLGAFRWRGGPGIPAEPGRGEDGEELHPRLEYSIPEMRGAAFRKCFLGVKTHRELPIGQANFVLILPRGRERSMFCEACVVPFRRRR